MAYTVKVPAHHLALAPDLNLRIDKMQEFLKNIAIEMGATYFDLVYDNGFLVIDTDSSEFVQKFELLNVYLLNIKINIEEK